ncbi:calmodulin [Plakobranchus ocellatus]|uniref:Calmodulin n=1 Tax=Plakobranchus ocellatus TaxID=259542 RepID=A0AAV4D1T4_9GAST|nr:calmodulin [Plakobranchus ocellatus]
MDGLDSVLREDDTASIASLFHEFFTQLANILKDKDQETCYKEMFRILDDTRKGFLTCEDVRTILRSIQTQVQMSDQELDDVLDDIDKNKDGKVDFSGETTNSIDI